MRMFAIVLVAAALAPVAAAEPKPAAVTQTAIGSARLGLTESQYVKAVGEQPLITAYGNGTKRLLFPDHELSVLLGANGRGSLVSTAAHEYTLRGGVGACSPLAQLRKVYKPSRHTVDGPFGARTTLYRVGNLWFTLSTPTQIGRITLASGTPLLLQLRNEPQCGIGEEG